MLVATADIEPLSPLPLINGEVAHPTSVTYALAYDSHRARSRNAARVWRDETSGRARALAPTSIRRRRKIRRCGKSRSPRKNRTARVHRRAQRVPRDAGGFSLHRSARGLGTHGMGARPVFVSASHNFTAACPAVLGHGRLAYGLECQRRGNE